MPDGANAHRGEFIALFENGVTYGPLMAEGSTITPVSVRQCKYGACGTVVDAAFEVGGLAECGCGMPLESSKGGVSLPIGLRRQRTQVHMNVDDTAADGDLFTRRTLSSSKGGHIFRGSVRVDAVLPVSAAAWLQSVTALRVGGRRSTGGEVQVTLSDGVPELLGPSQHVVLVFASPAILTDASGLPLDLTSPDAVRDALTDEIGDVFGVPITKVTTWTRDELVGGWHAASGLPKPMERALAVGSVLRIDLAEPTSGEAIGALRDRGLGLRRGEGFGHVVVRAIAWAPTTVEAEAPSTAVPDEVMAYVRDLLGSPAANWLAVELRDLVEALAATPPGAERPAAVLLDRRTYRELSGSIRERVRDLIEKDTRLIYAVQARLRAELRLQDAVAKDALAKDAR
ncbi:type III-B CRISPR module-associated Cmr3 family protein [Promicromonospora sp. NPDC057138]|uniref:type III-B CRISPR module-associated Cmr3 family protein n=1 Tax=Promicromonospora sp. NPDC057138 TaxID=3346031 RepID=UPI0036259E27